MAVLSLNGERAQRISEKLARELGAEIGQFLRDPDVVEILLNADGVLWVERLGAAMAPFGKMDPAQAESLMATVASTVGMTLTHDNPILECELPFDGSRFSAVIPPTAKAPCFTIRRHAVAKLTLDHYVERGIMKPGQRDRIIKAIINRENIIVAGGTSSGKTTLTNAVLREVTYRFPDDRVVVIEELRELQCESKNKLELQVSPTVDMEKLLRHTLRQRPDRIIVGEVRGPEALVLLRAMNTGHPGEMTTLHANSAKEALWRLESMVAQATDAPMQKFIAMAVNLVVFTERDELTHERRVRDVLTISGHDGQDYIISEGELT